MSKKIFLSIFILMFVVTTDPKLTTAQCCFKDVEPDKSAPTGDRTISYPQISIRTNRTPIRTDLSEIVKRADDVASKYPMADKKQRAAAVTKELSSYFGSGSLGHAWIIIFNSPKVGDYTSYGYHEGYGFVKNGKSFIKNDSAERKFNIQRTLPLKRQALSPVELEKKVIPEINKQSIDIANIMGLYVKDPQNGAYTPITNCAWFAGNLWNVATGEKLIFEQSFDGPLHADNWGMDFLNNVFKIADPGVIAESIAK